MDTNISVLKFGGTSVGSGERIRRVATIIANTLNNPEETFPVVVVSAMSGITDQLLRIARHAWAGENDACAHELHTLKQKHLEAAEKAVHNREIRHVLCYDLEKAFTGLEKAIAALQDVGANSRNSEPQESMRKDRSNHDDVARRKSYHGRSIPLRVAAIATPAPWDGCPAPKGIIRRDILRPHIDAVASWGERFSVLLVAAAARDVGVQATSVREEVIITSNSQQEQDDHRPLEVTFAVTQGADPLTEETRANAQALIYPLVEQQVVPIAAGFIGRTKSGTVTTLGRNGSDYSATVIGAALDCVEVSIYTDVDGVLSADPRLVANARLLPELSYAEAARLSWFGAKVLHPRTLIPLAHRNIPVRVRNTFRPHIRGTLVGPQGAQQSGAAAITVRRHLALITVESTDLFGAPENAGQVFALAARAGAAPVAICSSSGHHLSFVVEEQAAESVVALLQHDIGTWSVRTRSGLAACACIGSGFTVDPMSPARAITALAQEHIPVVTQGASELGITLIVEDQDSERALRSLHRDLIAPVIPLVHHSGSDKRRGTL